MLGEWHPVVVHFPVALLLVVPVLDGLMWLRPHHSGWAAPTSLWLTAVGALGGIAATWLFHPLPSAALLERHRAAEVFVWHEWLAYAVCAGASLVAVMRWEWLYGGPAGSQRDRGHQPLTRDLTRPPIWLIVPSLVLALLTLGTAIAGHRLTQVHGVGLPPLQAPKTP